MAHRLHVMSYGSKGFISIVPKMMTEVIGTDSQEVIEDSEESEIESEIEFETEEGGSIKTVRFVDEMERFSAVGRKSVSQLTPGTAQNLICSMRINRGVPPQRLIETMEASVELPEIAAQLNYLSSLQEIDNRELRAVELALVGAGIDTENLDTNKLRVLNYKQAMKSDDKSEWKKEIKAEFDRFEKYKVFKPVPRNGLPDGEKVLTTTWAFKHKQMVLGEVN